MGTTMYIGKYNIYIYILQLKRDGNGWMALDGLG